MDDLLAKLIADCRNKDYLTVSGKLWEPGSPFMERCPEGCHLEIYQKPANWDKFQAMTLTARLASDSRQCSQAIGH